MEPVKSSGHPQRRWGGRFWITHMPSILNIDAENNVQRDVSKAGYPYGGRQGVYLLLALVIVMLTLIVYVQARDFDFISYDDPIYTTDNPVVQKGLTVTGIIWSFIEGTYHTNYWAPLTWVTFLIDSEIFGLDPGGYHMTNVFFHILNALLVFGAFAYLTGSMWKSFWLAVLFALHPLHVESVAWVSERKDVVSTFFWMLTLIAYSRYVRKPGTGRYSVVFLLFVCCLMGKPMGVTLPFVLLLLDYWPLGRYLPEEIGPVRTRWLTFGKMVREKIPLFIIIAFIAPLTYYAQGKAGALKPLADIPLVFRLENVLVSYAGQILKTFWPVNLGLLYPYPATLPFWQPVSALLLLGAITGMTLKYVARFPYLVVGWLWFLGTFVPVAGFFVIGPHVTADRYTYIPLIGFFLMLIWGGFDLFNYLGVGKKLIVSLGVIVVAALTWLSGEQVGYWKNNITIYEHTLAVTENNWPVHLNLAAAYQKEQRFGQALEHYEKALHMKPELPELQLGVGEVLTAMGRIGAAVSHYGNLLNRGPGSAAIHTALATALSQSGKVDNAIAHYLKAIEIDGDFAEAYNGLGVTLVQDGQVDRAIGYYRRAIQIDSKYALAYYNLGVALIIKGENKPARTRFQEAIAADPDFADPHYTLGVLDLKEGDPDAARDHFNQALKIDPLHPGARKGLKVGSSRERGLKGSRGPASHEQVRSEASVE
jgi:tetratricopeptide (TPR) repeat protein